MFFFGYSTDTFLFLSSLRLLPSEQLLRTKGDSFLALKLYISGIHQSKRRLDYNSSMPVNAGNYHPDKRLEVTCLRRATGWEVTIHEHQWGMKSWAETGTEMGLCTGVLLFTQPQCHLQDLCKCPPFLHLHLSKTRGHEYNFLLSCIQNHQALEFLLRFCNASFIVI